MNKQTLTAFMNAYPQLELVDDKELHKELHYVDPDWYVFIARDRGVIEVHDTKMLEGNDIITTHIMTEQHVTWKIVHDANVYNSKNFNLEDWLTYQEDVQDREDAFKAQMNRAAMIQQTKDYLYGNK